MIFTSIKAYQYFLSPLIGNCCKFYPSCSTYALDAFATHGFFYGFYLTSKRILKCSPISQGGIDLVPETKARNIKH